MTTIIMLFILPLGIMLYFYDKKIHRENLETFDEYVEKIKNSDLSDEEKLLKINDMYYNNGYINIHKTDKELVVQKKHFNLGVLLMYFGALTYFGFIFYYIYYKFFLKPEQIRITLENNSELS